MNQNVRKCTFRHAPIEETDQYVHLRRLISLRRAFWVATRSTFSSEEQRGSLLKWADGPYFILIVNFPFLDDDVLVLHPMVYFNNRNKIVTAQCLK